MINKYIITITKVKLTTVIKEKTYVYVSIGIAKEIKV